MMSIAGMRVALNPCFVTFVPSWWKIAGSRIAAAYPMGGPGAGRCLGLPPRFSTTKLASGRGRTPMVENGGFSPLFRIPGSIFMVGAREVRRTVSMPMVADMNFKPAEPPSLDGHRNPSHLQRLLRHSVLMRPAYPLDECGLGRPQGPHTEDAEDHGGARRHLAVD